MSALVLVVILMHHSSCDERFAVQAAINCLYMYINNLLWRIQNLPRARALELSKVLVKGLRAGVVTCRVSVAVQRWQPSSSTSNHERLKEVCDFPTLRCALPLM
jgi:hypothetical protein